MASADGDMTNSGPYVPAICTRGVLRLAADAGLSEARWRTRPGCSEDRDSLALSDCFRLLAQLSEVSDDETCRASSRPLLRGTTEFVMDQAGRCATLRDAMAVIARSFDIAHGGSYNHVELRGRRLVYRIDDTGFPYVPGRSPAELHFTLDCILAFLHMAFRLLTGEAAGPALRGVATRQQEADLRTLWRVPVRAGAPAAALEYDAAAADLPLLSPRTLAGSQLTYAAVYRLLADEVDGRAPDPGLDSAWVRRVEAAFAQGLATQPTIARHLGVSVATLRRRLAEQGLTFRDLRARNLNIAAQALLRQRLRLEDIADTLGFADFRSFTRAFKQWNGMTPRAFAEAQAAPRSSTADLRVSEFVHSD